MKVSSDEHQIVFELVRLLSTLTYGYDSTLQGGLDTAIRQAGLETADIDTPRRQFLIDEAIKVLKKTEN